MRLRKVYEEKQSPAYNMKQWLQSEKSNTALEPHPSRWSTSSPQLSLPLFDLLDQDLALRIEIGIQAAMQGWLCVCMALSILRGWNGNQDEEDCDYDYAFRGCVDAIGCVDHIRSPELHPD